MRLHPDLWLDLTGKTGLDCWGLVAEVFRRRGIAIGFDVSTSDQWSKVECEPEPGDLLLIGGPTHVGVALDGDSYLHVRHGAAAAVASSQALRRAGKLAGVYRHTGKVAAETFDPADPACVRVVHIADPVRNPTGRDWQVVPWKDGLTIGALAPAGSNAVVLPIGPRKISLFADEPVAAGSTVLYVTAPGLIDPITDAWLIPLLSGIFFGVLSVILAPALPKPGKPDDPPTPTFDLTGVHNTVDVGIAQPVVYGEHKVGGNFNSAFQRVGDDGRAELYCFLQISRGPIHSMAGITIDSDELAGTSIPDDIEIDDNPASQYDCSVSIRLGTSGQAAMPGFHEAVTAYTQTPTLDDNVPWGYQTVGRVTGFDLQVDYPNGLWVQNISNGSLVALSIYYSIQWRVTGTTTWTTDNWTNTAARRSSTSFQYRKRGLTRDSYEIQITRTSPAYPDVAASSSQGILGTVNEITSDAFTYPGKALLGFRIRATEQLGGGIPKLTAKIKGRKVWVWDGISTTNPGFGTEEIWTDNPAWCALDLLINPLYGMGRSGRLTIDNVDLNDFDAWADYCDTLVDDGRGGTTKRATCNAVFDTVTSGWESFQSLCRSAWAEPYIATNKVKIALLKATTSTFLFGSGNSRGLKVTKLGKSSRANACEVQFTNEETNYESDVATRVNETAVYTNGEPIVTETVSTTGVTRAAQAYRLAAFRRNFQELSLRQAEWVGGPDSAHLLPGDVSAVQGQGIWDGASGRTLANSTSTTVRLDRTITVVPTRVKLRVLHEATDVLEEPYIPAGTFARNAVITLQTVAGAAFTWANIPVAGTRFVIDSVGSASRTRLFRITSIRGGQNLDREYTGTEDSDAIYDDDPGDVEEFTDELPNKRAIPTAATVQAFEYQQASCDGSTVDAIRVEFTSPERWQRAEIWYRLSMTSAWTFAGWSRNEYVIAPVACGQTYEVAVVLVSVGGTRQQIENAGTACVYVRGYRTAPAAPSSVQGFVVAGMLTVNVAQTTADATIFGYEIRYGANWAASLLLAKQSSRTWTAPCPFVGTQRIRVKSISNVGVYSTAEVTADPVHTVAESIYTTDVNTSEDAAFAGTKTNTTVTASQLQLSGSNLTGTYQSADSASALTKETQIIAITSRCSLADVAMTWDDCAFTFGSDLAASLTWATAYLSGAEVQYANGLTWGQAGFTWGSMPASLITWAGPTDVYAALAPTVDYDVNTGSGFSGSWTNYPGSVAVDNLTGVRARVTLNRPHSEYDPRLVTLNVKTLAVGASEPVPQTITLGWSTATAANARTIGLTVADTVNKLTVPASKKLVVIGYDFSVITGATGGTYTIDAIIRNISDSADVIVATLTSSSTGTNLTSMGTWTRSTSGRPTLAAGKDFSIGAFNRASSPGALSARAHHVTITYILEDV